MMFATAVFLLALAFLCLPFHSDVSGDKGPGATEIACRAPILAGWRGGRTTRNIPGGAQYSAAGQCGQDARTRLLIGGIPAILALAAGVVVVVRGIRGDYPLPSSI